MIFWVPRIGGLLSRPTILDCRFGGSQPLACQSCAYNLVARSWRATVLGYRFGVPVSYALVLKKSYRGPLQTSCLGNIHKMQIIFWVPRIGGLVSRPTILDCRFGGQSTTHMSVGCLQSGGPELGGYCLGLPIWGACQLRTCPNLIEDPYRQAI